MRKQHKLSTPQRPAAAAAAAPSSSANTFQNQNDRNSEREQGYVIHGGVRPAVAPAFTDLVMHHPKEDPPTYHQAIRTSML